MASTSTPVPSTERRPAASRRFGYLVAIAVNGIMLWVVHHLLEWQWPSFLTADFADVLWLLSASLVAGMVVNAAFLVRDRGRLRAIGDLITTAFGLAVSIRMWSVFPFDFSSSGTDWSWLLRVGLVVGIVGTVIALIAHAVKLVEGA